ncbi:MATE family efflux transporter [Malaciobacter canalis]|uniref:MATE family efflux transporter n=1 Tax=Malaciobacter canalis TaxID=1912871 RepID=UPI00384E098B
MLTTKPIRVFFKYAIPSILGLLAISSAGIIDGYFVGNYVGPTALAAMNMSYPIITIIIGFSFMFAVGSSVICGKLMGENNLKEANNIFSKSIIFIIFSSILLALLLYFNLDNIFSLFNAKEDLKNLTVTYLSIIIFFIPILMVAIVLDFFVRVDEQPNLAFFALFSSAIANIVLDYIFVVQYEFGIKGAAYATGISQAFIFFILLPYFLSEKSSFSFIKPYGNFSSIFKAMKNGSSEFINESSAGITVIIFNYIMLQNFGTFGVTAYTIIGYFITVSMMINFAIADSMQPVISKNFGALNYQRIDQFLKIASIFLISIAVVLVTFILSYPDVLIEFFLEGEHKKDIENLTLQFIYYSWPAFLFSGISILITSYFTSIQKPFYSIIIAISRSFIFPISLIIILPIYLGTIGIFVTLALSEFFTFLIAIYLFLRKREKMPTPLIIN